MNVPRNSSVRSARIGAARSAFRYSRSSTSNATRKIAEPLNPGVAVDRLRVLRCWPLHVPQGDDVIDAAELAHRGQVSFWDAMIIRSAAALGCLVLWSANLSHGQCIDGVTVRNPFLP